MFALLAAEGGGPAIDAQGWFLENAWLIPLIMGVSFVTILFFGKRLPRGGSEVGIAAVGVCFVLSLLTAGQWISEVNRADDCEPIEVGEGRYECADHGAEAGGFGENELAAGLGGFGAVEEEGEEGKGAALNAAVSQRTWWSTEEPK